ncbi:MAG TPA: SH3 domain-containing protein [Opitutales bacterium]|jgi:hypothetical protein|nr:SH3 domain-containing protein [Opitutales bacterium]
MKNIFVLILGLVAAAAPYASAQTSTPAPASTGLQLSAPLPALPATSSGGNATTATPSSTSAPATIIPIPADPAQAFAAGVAAYEKNDFSSAQALFAGAESKSVSAPLEYNFGNASFQAKDYGAAVLHYLRVLTLSPRDPDARQNLALARKAANISLADPTHWESFAAWMSINAWVGLLTVAGWATVYLAVLPRLFRWRGAMPWLLCATMAVVTVAAGVGYWGAQKHAADGVVQVADTNIKLSPTADSPAIGVLQPGEVAQTLEAHNGFFKVQTTDGRLGWVDAANYSPVWNWQ